MNDRDIARIERTVGHSLPASYSALLRNLPLELECLLKLRSRDSRRLFTEAATIIRWNKFFRRPGYEYENEAGELCSFPGHHIVIGATGGGDFFHLNAKKKRPEVLLWSHDDGEFSVCAKSLAEFVRRIFSSAADIALDRIHVQD